MSARVLAWLLPIGACAQDLNPWLDEPVVDNVLARRFVGIGSASVVCILAHDAAEVHRASGRREVTLYGLLADETYTCSITTDGRAQTLTFTTDPVPAFVPTWTLTAGGEGTGYTLFNSGFNDKKDRQSKLLLVDAAGRLRWYYVVPYEAPDLDASYLGEGLFLYGGGYSAPPTVIDLAGTVLLQAPPPSAGRVWHHHAGQLATGEFVSLGTTRNEDRNEGDGNEGDGNVWLGATVEILDPGLTGATWVWNTQQGVDEGWLPTVTRGDPYHANAVIVEGQDVDVSFRNLDLLVRLDRASGNRVWSLGAGGDFALVTADGSPDDPSNWFFGQHAPERDGNRFLLYDNGDSRLPEPQSRIVEFEVDEAARTARVLWEHTEPGWYEPIWGDVDRLPDGNVLFTRGHTANKDPTGLQRTQIVELDAAREVRWRLEMDEATTTGYRSERIDGCALFANDNQCPR